MKAINMDITRAQSKDAEECVEIIFDSDMGKKYYPTRRFLLMEIEKGIAEDEFYVMKDCDKKIIGILWYQIKGAFHSFPYLHIIAVENSCQNQGKGAKLLNFFEKEALKDSNLRQKVFLIVGEFNVKAEQFYKNKGYVKVCEIEGLFRKNITEKLYMKILANGGESK